MGFNDNALPFGSIPGRWLQLRDSQDPYRWLEKVESVRSLAWVDVQNAETAARLARDKASFHALVGEIAEIIETPDKLPFVRRRGEFLYHFQRDGSHPRGIWRRTTPEEFQRDDPAWDVLLDIDALATLENTPWVWAGASLLHPTFERGLISLSRGGGDAAVVREFDLRTREFISDGFSLAEAKSSISWIDEDSVFVATDWGHDSLTKSGYPRIVKRWRRGETLDEAETVFEGSPSDMSVFAFRDHTPGYEREVFGRKPSFFTTEYWINREEGPSRIEVPDDAGVAWFNEWMLIELRDPWLVANTTYPSGSLLVTRSEEWLKGERNIEVLYTPSARCSLESFSTTKNTIVLTELNNVRTRLYTVTREDNGWVCRRMEGLPENSVIRVIPSDPFNSDEIQLFEENYVTPPTLFFGSATRTSSPDEYIPVKRQRPLFDATGLVVTQHEATSADGTLVPYFQVARADLPLDGTAPTIVRGYGGFGISEVPSYAPKVGKGWLEKGGVFVTACIRGGGEFGPLWHEAARKRDRHRAYEDFVAVSRDLVRRGVATSQRIGAWGGSNGGLLTGNMLATYPKDWGAIVSEVPLLDMFSFNHLLAGDSWVDEYGNPTKPEDWLWLRRYSPYHQVRRGRRYPPALFTTSTRDDRVHPAHARKMVARMHEFGIPDVFLYEAREGGHSGMSEPRHEAKKAAVVFRFFAEYLRK